MPPLKNLERDFPAIDSNFQRFCASHGISSVEDFLVHDLDALVALAERDPSSEALKQGITQIVLILDHWHQPWQNGVELLSDAVQNKHFISTGFEGIDMLLKGGLRKGQLTELVGPSSSGKTQVCLCTAAHVADRNLGTVLFLDTGNSFSPKQIVSIVKGRNLERIMSRIFYQTVFDIFTLLEILKQPNFTMKEQVMNEDSKLCLLIIDSISSLVTPILGGKGSRGRSLMVSAGFLLKRLAHEHNLAVLVINHTVGGEGGTSKPALGESWKSIPHVRLFLSRDQESGVCCVSVLKHALTALGQSAKFVMGNV